MQPALRTAALEEAVTAAQAGDDDHLDRNSGNKEWNLRYIFEQNRQARLNVERG